MAYRARASSMGAFVDALKAHGVLSSPNVEAALRRVDRAHYIPHNPYEDRPQGLSHGQTISAPHMHIHAMELLEPFICKEGSTVLDVGVGSGFLPAAFREMGAGKVVGIDIVPELVDLARKNLNADGRENDCAIDLRVGDGWKGDPANAPFDAIHVGAAAASIPEALVQQLAAPGRMIIPVGPQGGEQVLMCIDKDAEGGVTKKELMGVVYVPLVHKVTNK